VFGFYHIFLFTRPWAWKFMENTPVWANPCTCPISGVVEMALKP